MKYLLDIKNFIIKFKFIILASFFIIVFIVFGAFSYYIYEENNKIKAEVTSQKNLNKNTLIENEESLEKTEEVKFIFVDIKGLVKKPGVYKVEENKRVNDIIKLAGGFIKNANTNYLNLSKKVVDEMVIIVYSNQEVKDMEKNDEKVSATLTTNESSNNEENNSLININTALETDLMTLSGIGEVKAKAIIEYRNEFGNFVNIEDIMKVNGISESTYSKIKNFITI